MKTLFLLFCIALVSSISFAQADEQRIIDFSNEGEWAGAGIAYGEYRDGQSPDGDAPTNEQLREDLHIIKDHWQFIRLYGTRSAERVCAIIREDNLPIRMMLGAWIATESSPEATSANRSEVANAIRIANAYPDVVAAINVGNETQVFWSGHRVNMDTLLDYLAQVRSATSVPVTTCDDYNFWNKPESTRVAEACDFIGLHAYAMWNGQQLHQALNWTREQIRDIQQRHPEKMIVHCETGWATTVHTEGEQAKLIKGKAGGGEQELFYRAYRHWADEARMPHFFFAAFDENWKGGSHPNEVEKHWGLFNADRSPKPAMKRWIDAQQPRSHESVKP